MMNPYPLLLVFVPCILPPFRSHFLYVMMSERVLGAYYLGCAMTERFKTSLAEQLTTFSPTTTTANRPKARGSKKTRASDRSCAKNSAGVIDSTSVNQPKHTPLPAPISMPGLSEHKSVPPRVVKEDLVVVDGDLSDYPTEHILDIGK